MKTFFRKIAQPLHEHGPEPPHDLGRLLEITTSWDTTRKKIELLSLAKTYLTGADAHAILWIYDGAKNVLMPQYAEPAGAESKTIADMKDWIVRVDRQAASEVGAAAIHSLRKALQSTVLYSAGSQVHELYPAYSTEASAERSFVGILHSVSDQDTSASAKEFLEYISGALGRTVRRTRQNTRLKAVERLLKAIHVNEPTKEALLTQAAQVVIDLCEAEKCVVFQQTATEELKAIVCVPGNAAFSQYIASAESLIYKVCRSQESKRILEFQNSQERESTFGSESYDRLLYQRVCQHLKGGNVRTWLSVPVVADGRTLAVFLICNKRTTICERFTENDQAVAESVASVIQDTVLAAEIHHAMDMVTQNFSLEILDTDSRHSRLYAVLAKLIPTVDGAIIRKIRLGAGSENIVLGQPGSLAAYVESAAEADINKIPQLPYPLPDSIAGGTRHVFRKRVPATAGLAHSYELILGLSTSVFTRYESRMLDIFLTQLGLVLAADESAEGNLGNLVLVRHAIRGSLTGILGNVDTIQLYAKTAEGDPNSAAFLKTAGFRKAVERAKVYGAGITALLESSRVLFAGLEHRNLRFGTVSLGRIARDTALALRFLAEERGLHINVDNKMRGDDSQVVDKAMIELALFSLLDNAIKYSFRDETIRLVLTADSKNWQIIVMDTGVYIPPENYEAIFEKFIRKAVGRSAAQRPGTGLGLSLVKQVVDAHGGTIKVESEYLSRPNPGQGERAALTSFAIRVPVVQRRP